jgi:hypothetical protein
MGLQFPFSKIEWSLYITESMGKFEKDSYGVSLLSFTAVTVTLTDSTLWN